MASTDIDDAIRLLADNKESDVLLDVLNIYSEELLESDEENTNGAQLSPINSIGNQIAFHEQTSLLGSIKDLITIDERSHLKPTQLSSNLIGFVDNNNNNNYPLSPLSCNSDSGYESVCSPSLSLSDPLMDSPNVCLEQSFTELFPDLV